MEEATQEVDSGDVRDQNIDAEALSRIIKTLSINYDSLSSSKKLSVINLILKVSITRDASKLVVPTLE